EDSHGICPDHRRELEERVTRLREELRRSTTAGSWRFSSSVVPAKRMTPTAFFWARNVFRIDSARSVGGFLILAVRPGIYLHGAFPEGGIVLCHCAWSSSPLAACPPRCPSNAAPNACASSASKVALALWVAAAC